MIRVIRPRKNNLSQSKAWLSPSAIYYQLVKSIAGLPGEVPPFGKMQNRECGQELREFQEKRGKTIWPLPALRDGSEMRPDLRRTTFLGYGDENHGGAVHHKTLNSLQEWNCET